MKALGMQAPKPAVSAKSAPLLAEPGPPQAWDERLPDEVDVDVSLQDWLFALEGVGTPGGRQGEYSHCWHSRFDKLQVGADSSSKGEKNTPLQEVMVSR